MMNNQENPFIDKQTETKENPFANQSANQQGTPFTNQPANQQGTPFTNQPASQQGTPFTNQSANQQGTPFTNQPANQQGTAFTNQPASQQGTQPANQQGSPFINPYGFPQQMGNYQSNMNTGVGKKFLQASKVSIIGSSVALAGAVISLIITIYVYTIAPTKSVLGVKIPDEYKSAFLGTIVLAFIGVFLCVILVVLSLLMKKVKSKALIIVLIVFSSISIIIWLIGLFLLPILANDLHGTTAFAEEILKKSETLSTVRQVSTLSILPGFISLGGLITLLVGSIMGVGANNTEFNAN